MSGTYTVGPNPGQIVPNGAGTKVSLYNKGPSTIYLEDNTSVSIANGMQLPPMGQMTWNSGVPLWAMTASGGAATLVVNDSAGQLDANRSRFWSLLKTVNNPDLAGDPVTVECGHCETLLLKVTLDGNQPGGTAPGVVTFLLTWTDDFGNVIDVDKIDVAPLVQGAGFQPQVIFIRIPVIGTNLSFIDFQAIVPIQFVTFNTFEIYGTDRSLSYRYYCHRQDLIGTQQQTPVLAFNPGVVSAAYKTVGDGIIIEGITTFTDITYLASMGKRLALNFTVTNATGSGRKEIRSYSANDNIASVDIPVATGVKNTYAEFDVPVKDTLMIVNNGGLGGTSMTISATWKDT